MDMRKIIPVLVIVFVAELALGNLLDNPGFEWELGPENWSVRWGNVGVESWNNPPEGHFAAYIKGKWGGGAENGGVIQVLPITPGLTYVLKVRLYVDNGWTANRKELKLEFFDDDGILVRSFADDLKELKEGKWVVISLQGNAPADASRAQVVLEAEGVGDEGVLGADAFELIEIVNQR